MRRLIAVVAVITLLTGSAVAAKSKNRIEEKYAPYMDWFSSEEALKTDVPDGLTAEEEELFREAYALGHYAALHPKHEEGMYVLNNATKKFHYSDCLNTLLIETRNREHSYESKEELEKRGYKSCGSCKP